MCASAPCVRVFILFIIRMHTSGGGGGAREHGRHRFGSYFKVAIFEKGKRTGTRALIIII